jgi:putative ABC transport system ATP-binding protein
MTAVVEVRDVTKEYRRGAQVVRALRGVSIAIEPGRLVSIVGPSGSGKSSLLHLLGGLDTPTAGAVFLEGRDLASLSDDELTAARRHRVGFVFQFFNLLPTLAAWENVAVPRLLDGVPLRRSRASAVELLERVGLGHRVGHRPAELSGGEMQRVAIARALMVDPALILADEPTGNLDSESGAGILDLLRDCVARDNCTVVMVTHDLGAASKADQVVEIADGRVVAPAESRRLVAGPRLASG